MNEPQRSASQPPECVPAPDPTSAAPSAPDPAALPEALVARLELKKRWDGIRNPDLFQLLVLTVPPLLAAERCSVFLLDPASGKIWLEAGTGVVQRQILVEGEGSMVGEAIRSGEPVRRGGLAASPGDHQRVGRELEYTVHTALTYPIRDGRCGKVIAALQVLNKRPAPEAPPETTGGFDDADLKQLEAISYAIQPSLEVMYHQQEIVHEASRLDREIEILKAREQAIRPGHMLRTFPPLQALSEDGFLHHSCFGKAYPPFIDGRCTELLRQTWDTEANDVLICTAQKVGTHLAKKYLVELVTRNVALPSLHPCVDGDIGHGAVPWPEVALSQGGEAEWMAFLGRTALHPRLWYTHCTYDGLPCRRIHPETRFVLVVRDPRAVAVSQYHFWSRHPLLGVRAGLELDEFVGRFLADDLYFGSYHSHVLSWLQRCDQRLLEEQVCLLHYEDMVTRKPETVDRLQRLLFPDRALTAEQVEAVAAATEFDTMKSEISANPRSFHLNPQLYFRSGTVDSWSRELSPAAIEAINAATRQRWGGGHGGGMLERYVQAAGGS